MPMVSDSDLPHQLKANAPTLSSNLDNATKDSQQKDVKGSRDEMLQADSQPPVLDKDSSAVKGTQNSASGSDIISGLPGLSHQSLGLTPGALGLPSTRGSSSALTLPSMTSALLGAAAGFGLQASALGGSLQHTSVLSSSTSNISTTTVPDNSPALSQPWSLNQHLNIASAGSQRLSAFTSLKPSGTLVANRGSTPGSAQTSSGSSELSKPTSISTDSAGQNGVSTASAISLQLHPRPMGGPLSFPSPQSASPAGAADHLIRMGGSHTPGVSHSTLSAMYHPSMLGTYPDFPLPPGLPPLCKYTNLATVLYSRKLNKWQKGDGAETEGEKSIGKR